MTEVLQGFDVPMFGEISTNCVKPSSNSYYSTMNKKNENNIPNINKGDHHIPPSSFPSLHHHHHQHVIDPTTHTSTPSSNTPDLKYCELWEDMVQDVDSLFEWAIANKLNKIEWLLLGNFKWQSFDVSDLRWKRLRILTRLGHEYGLLVGADVPIGNHQQLCSSSCPTLPYLTLSYLLLSYLSSLIRQ